jgi:hypothetical protein
MRESRNPDHIVINEFHYFIKGLGDHGIASGKILQLLP